MTTTRNVEKDARAIMNAIQSIRRYLRFIQHGRYVDLATGEVYEHKE